MSCYNYSLHNQLKIQSDISNILKDIININKPKCGFKNYKILKTDDDEEEIKGIPYLCNTYDDLPVLMKVFPKEQDTDKDTSFIELSYLELFNNEILIKGLSPNIPFLYKFFIDIDNNKKGLYHIPYKKIKKINKIQPCSNILICEYFQEQDIDNWVDNHEDILTESHWKSIIFQVIYILALLQDKYNFMHNDLHPGNILIDTVSPSNDIEYIFYDKHYKVRNLGYIAKLWDFEFSNLHKEEYNSYQNNINFDIGYNETYDLHNFLKGLLEIEVLPINTIDFINSLYPPELIYSKNGEINTSNNTVLLFDGTLTTKALKSYDTFLPTPKELINHEYFSEYTDEPVFNKYMYP